MNKEFEDIIDEMVDQAEGLETAQRQTASEQLRDILAKLDLIEEIQPPAGLIQRTLDYIRRHTLPRPAGNRLAPLNHQRDVADSSPWRWLAGNLRDLIATAAVMALIFLAGRPGLQQIRNVAQQYQCASNMRAIGQGVNAYAASYDGFLPYAPANSQSKPWQPGPADQSRGDNTRSLFLLVQGNYLHPSNLACPSRPGQRFPTLASETCRQCEDLPKGFPLGYSIQILQHPERLNGNRDDLLAADKNPIFEQMPTTMTETLDITRLSRHLLEQNSPNHQLRGQNLLHRDGMVQFASSRLLPINQDDIFTINDTRHYDGTQLPGPGDIFLP